MAIFFQTQEKQKNKPILLFIALILFFSFLAWWFFSRREITVLDEVHQGLNKEIKINFEILAIPEFQRLEPYLRIEEFKPGRVNPFISF